MSRPENHQWASGTLRDRRSEINKSLTQSSKLSSPLIPLRKETDEEEMTGDYEEEESEDSDVKASSSSQVAGDPKYVTNDELLRTARESMEKALKRCGYDPSLLDNDDLRKAMAAAMLKCGEIVSEKTGKLWIERSIPEEAPAFVRPRSLKIGDRVQILNWVPLGVHGAVVDLYPKGKVSKIYTAKCLVTKEPMPFGIMPTEKCAYEEEERVIGLELDGKGQIAVKEKGATPFPYVVKDRSIIMRFPPMADPSFETDHVNPGLQ